MIKRFKGLGVKLNKYFPSIQYDLEKTDIKLKPAEYLTIGVLSCFGIFLLFSILLSISLYFGRKLPIITSIILGILLAILLTALAFFILIKYPKILAKKKAELLEKNLVFALKDILLEVSSGVSLYNALINVSKANYGLISKEIEKVAKQINSGKTMDKALEDLAIKSESEYLRKTTWQLINTLRAGSSLKDALKTIIRQLTNEQKTKIQDYAKELNMWSLIYMLFAVAIPSIGITLLVILSSFAGMSIGKPFIIAFITICFIVQFVLIGLIKTRRPVVYI